MSSTCEGHSHQWDVVRGRGVCADIMMLILANIFILSMITYAFIDNCIQWHPTSVLLPGKSQGWRSLVGCSPWGREESDTTEQLHFHFSLSCIGEGSGNPLQRSCLENPRDGGAGRAAVYGVAQSRTQLKWLSSRSSIQDIFKSTSIFWLYLRCFHALMPELESRLLFFSPGFLQ